MMRYAKFFACGLLLSNAVQWARADEADTIEVYAHRQTRQLENVTRSGMDEAPPGTSPLKALEDLPGVEFQDSDPFGNYEWAERLSMRGFAQGYLGFTLDDIPLGDMNYSNDNGLHISRAISSENIRAVTLAQGTGALNTASTSNLGGTVQFYSDDPAQAPAARALIGLGTQASQRTYVRFDSGRSARGTSGYVSYTFQDSNKWKGVGSQRQEMVNAKLLQRVGTGRISLFYDHSQRKEKDYQDMSQEMIDKLGYYWDNYSNLQQAVDAANGHYSPAVAGLLDPLDAAYGGSSGLRDDELTGLAGVFDLSDALQARSTLYYHHDNGQGHWVTPYQATPNGLPLSVRTTEYQIGRYGANNALSWNSGNQTVDAGLWLEHSVHTLTRSYYGLYALTADTDFTWLHDPFLTLFKQRFVTSTRVFYVEDTVSLMQSAVKVNFGFKSPQVDISTVDLVGTRAQGNLKAGKSFLPQLGFDYEWAPGQEVFASASRNMRAFQPGINGPFSMTQAAFDVAKNSLRPETSTTIELGYRFRRGGFAGVVDVYHTLFSDRLLQIAQCSGIVGCPSVFANVGRVRTKGIEAALKVPMARHFDWFNSFSYNVSTYGANYYDGATFVAAAGKDVVDAPRTSFDSSLDYDDGHWFARLTEKYTAKRYYTYVNDAWAPGYLLANLDVGHRLRAWAGMRDVRIGANVTNLFNRRYIATLGTNGFVDNYVAGDGAHSDGDQTLQLGSPRAAFLTVVAKF